MSPPVDPLEPLRELLGRIGRAAVRQRLTRVLVLWDLGYLREALSEFRVAAEEALRRVISARGGARADELRRSLEQGQATRVVERMYRGEDLLPARMALHLLTLLAWGNYASHAQQQGHHATAADLAVLISLAVELEEWLRNEVEADGSIFDPEDQALRQRQLQEQSTGHGLDARAAEAFVGEAGVVGVTATPGRLLSPQLGLELFWRPPTRRAPTEPYRGLRAFEPEDAPHFYGREALLRRLEQNVDTRRLTIVSGASGAGKTSLLRAGLIPSLLELGCGVLLASDYGERSLATVRALLDAWPERRSLVLIFDQLERLLGSESSGLRRELLELVASAGADRQGVRLVLGLREDHLGQLLREADGVAGTELLLEGDALVAVGPLDAEGTRQAVLRPLEGTGVEMDPTLLDEELLPDLLQSRPSSPSLPLSARTSPSSFGSLPCNLQIVCGRLYDQARARGQRRLDVVLYRELGGTRRILVSYLDETLASARYAGDRELAWSLLRAMTDGDARRWVDLGELWQRAAAGPAADAVRLGAVLDCLVEDRLVLVRCGELAASYSLVHDELARTLGARSSPSDLERQQAQARLDQALAEGEPRELWHGRTLRLLERHWTELRSAEQPRARAHLARARRARLLSWLGLGLLVATALVGVGFGMLQLRRALEERQRASRFADQGVLLRAQLELDHDPTQAVAWLRHLASDRSGVGVMTLVEESRRRGVAWVLPAPQSLKAVAFSRDGQLLAAGDEEGAVRLWEVSSRRPRGTPQRLHAEAVTALGFLPGGRLLSAGTDGALRLWEPGAASATVLLSPSTNALYALAATGNGDRVAAAGSDGRLHLFSLSRRQRLGPPLVAHDKAILALAFSPDGALLASGSLDRGVRIWRLGAEGEPPEPSLTLAPGHEVYALAISPDGRLLAVAGGEAPVQLFHLPEGSPAGELRSSSKLTTLAFSPDGKSLAAAGTDKLIQLWDLTRRAERGPPLRGHLGAVSHLAFSPDGRRLASASLDPTVRLWETSSRGAGGLRLAGHEGEVQGVAFSGSLLYSASRDGSVRRWSTTSGAMAGPALSHGAPVLSFAASPDAGLLATGGADGRVVLWQALEPRTLAVCSRGVYALAFGSKGTLLAAASGEGKVRLLSTRGEAPRELAAPSSIFALAFSPDGQSLVGAGQDRALHVWEPASGRSLGATDSQHHEPIYALAFSPDGRTLASGSGDATIQLWQLPGIRPLGAALLGHRHWVLGLGFAPDGQTLASGSSDGTVRLWDVGGRRPLGPPLLGHSDWVYAVAFSPDGRTLASASGDRTIWLWQLGSVGLTRLQDLIDELTNLHVLPDGRLQAR